MAFPNFFLLGAQKCGTTSLHEWLNEHPEVLMSSIKEPHFFSETDTKTNKAFGKTLNVVDDLDAYCNLFNGVTTETIIGESSPSYLWDGKAAINIGKMVPKPKFLISLRDPVKRAYSEYQMYNIAGLEKRSFDKAISDEIKASQNKIWGQGPQYIELGKYGRQLQRYVEEFKLSSIHIIEQENLLREPLEELNKLSKFLNISPNFWLNFDFQSNLQHQGGTPKNGLSSFFMHSRALRAAGRAFIPRKYRPSLNYKLFVNPGKKETIGRETKDAIWNEVLEDIKLLENICDRKFDTLWTTFKS